MTTCEVPSEVAGVRLADRAAGMMDDLYVDVDCAEAPIESPRGIERCIRTDSFLQEMVRDRGVVRLSKNEYRFLSVLVRSEGRTLTAGELMQSAFGSDHKRSSHYVRMYISLMRRRLERDPRNPQHIITEHRRGYRFCR
ncbi:MAG: winged helix-turn-helix domain-containing protein [Phycisphaerae bacterium]